MLPNFARPARPRKNRVPGPRGTQNQTVALLTAEEERELSARVKQGDASARERLVMANLRLVMCIANSYQGKAVRGLELDDLIQEGTLGLIRAAEDFDPKNHETRFATYAGFWIHHHIQRILADHSSTIRFPYYLILLRRRFEKAREELREARRADVSTRGSIEPSLDEIAEAMGVDVKQLKYINNAMAELRSCSPGAADDDPSQDEALIQDLPPERPLEVAETMQRLHNALRRLTLLEAWVIRRRFHLDDTIAEALAEAETPAPKYNGRRTLRELSREIGRPVRQLRLAEQSALAKLREVLDPDGTEGLQDRVEPSRRGPILVIRRSA